MSFTSAIHKPLKESNINDLLVEAGLIAQGSVVQALQGSHYNRPTRLCKLFYEAMLCIIISHGKKKILVPPTHLGNLFKSIGNTRLNSEKYFLAFQSILYDEDFSEYVKNLLRVQEGDNHMAKYVLSIMNMIEILFMNINTLRTKYLENILSSIRLMVPWMTVYDNTNYRRWLQVFWMEMSSLSQEHRQLIKKFFSQSLTGN